MNTDEKTHLGFAESGGRLKKLYRQRDDLLDLVRDALPFIDMEKDGGVDIYARMLDALASQERKGV